MRIASAYAALLLATRVCLGDCLAWSPQLVSLQGTVARETHPGPPDYESIEAGDKPEVYWFLTLDTPICVSGVSDLGVAQDEYDVAKVQLLLTSEQFDSFRDLLDRAVVASGKLVAAETGHHHTKVLLASVEMRRKEE